MYKHTCVHTHTHTHTCTQTHVHIWYADNIQGCVETWDQLSQIPISYLQCGTRPPSGAIGSALGLVDRCQYTVSGWDRKFDLQSLHLSVAARTIRLSSQIRQWHTLTCCWDVKQESKQPTNLDTLIQRGERVWLLSILQKQVSIASTHVVNVDKKCLANTPTAMLSQWSTHQRTRRFNQF